MEVAQSADDLVRGGIKRAIFDECLLGKASLTYAIVISQIDNIVKSDKTDSIFPVYYGFITGF